MEQMQRELADQRALIDGQSARLAAQQAEIDRLRRQVALAEAPRPALAQAEPAAQPAATALPGSPVGQAPAPSPADLQRVADLAGVNVLSRAGRLVIEPSLEYSSSSSNRLVFRGVELIPGVQIGVIEASNADRNTLAATATARFGITDNLEIEARVPYLIRSDRVEAIQQRQDTLVQQAALGQQGLGDVELGLRYQLNHPIGPQPIFIGTLSVKTPTGKSPFDVPFDAFGVAQGLATGSGFWAIQPGVSFLLPSDPVVIFGGASYVYQLPRTIDRTVGSVLVGRVDPGDAVTANLGFGFALNQRFSFSLGYKHTYIFPTRSELNAEIVASSRVQVGVLELGMSYRLSERQTLNFNLGIGATRDAPDLTIGIRAPFSVN
ncbi:MAG: transporter [Novosphingobium sp.]